MVETACVGVHGSCEKCNLPCAGEDDDDEHRISASLQNAIAEVSSGAP